jgi:inosine-uridine nucleoside N-ribohydrolase
MDVDDVWALAFLLKCPEVDVKLITTCTGDTAYRARLVAKLLQIAGREDIPIGVGIPLEESPATHAAWLGDFSFADYSGDVLRDGVGALCETVMATAETVSLVGIGPLPNIAAALAREPELTTGARFVGMYGSLRRGYMGAAKPMREFNVKQYPHAAQAVWRANWDKTITPLDTCGTVTLQGERFQSLLDSEDPLTRAVLDNHFGWYEAVKDWPIYQDLEADKQSSVLYDTVAVYLAFSEALLQMETLPLQVTAEGHTVIDESGDATRCATEWQDQEAFLDLLVERLTTTQSVL